MHRAIRNKSKFVQLDDGSLGILPEEWIHKITRYFQAGDIDEELLKIPKISYTEIQDLFEKEVLSEEVQAEIATYTQHFSATASIPEVAVPEALDAELRAYQLEGLNWLNFWMIIISEAVLLTIWGWVKPFRLLLLSSHKEKTWTYNQSRSTAYFPAFQLAGRTR